MKKDVIYAAALKKMQVSSSIAMRQAQGCLVREFGITLNTAAKATDRIFNGSIDSKNKDLAPLLELSDCKTFFCDIDQVEWYRKREHFDLIDKAFNDGVLVHISSARHKKRISLLK